ncbi:glycosyl hydrolase family 95 catalytic domain-containing protein [Paenibacillus pabuli]|uniref:glycosyl hydrolase family 95 catalytic domain-containing protein n=1 Tax=Paenibacillus pabuli TaxID=1472 RepID=UPI003CF55609
MLDAKHEWRDGMVSGNGENGYVTAGSPYSDTFIFQNMWFNFPSADPRFIPEELTNQVDDARWNVFHQNDAWNITIADGRKRVRTFFYSYHPGHQLRLNMTTKDDISSYERWTNYETAENGVRYTDSLGTWTRTSFTSREDNVSITSISKSSTNAKINMIISIDDIMSMSGARNSQSEVTAIQYQKQVDSKAEYIAQVVHYPSYPGSELMNGGYGGLTRVIVVNGTKRRILLPDTNETMNVGMHQNPAIEIIDADAVYFITQSARTEDMGEIKAFLEKKEFEMIQMLSTYTNTVAEKYKDNSGCFDYAAALAPHARKHASEFNAVRFVLEGDEEYKDMDNEQLIMAQQAFQTQINHAFIERVYDQGRYAMICCGGSSAPRLCGMWTGEWDPGWRGIYTLDANVNLQVSGMNTGNLQHMPLGYITFFLRNAPDFEANARMAYGMHDALQVSVNSDGDRAMHVEYDNDYPFEYWNAGASWCLLPIYEYWQCYGNQNIPIHENMRIHELQSLLGVQDGGLNDEQFATLIHKGYLDLEKDILLPLLTKQANFWDQICTPEYYTDVNGNACYERGKQSLESGEKYMIIPAYSPENHPIGYNSTITANATMDISAARDGLYMVIALEQAVQRKGYEKAVSKWETILKKLPSYQVDVDGALREWAMKEYMENNNHRHLSHLYPAWPAYETQTDSTLARAALIALKNRNKYNTGDATAGHGWMHKALVTARLKDGDGVVASLLPMMIEDGYYDSFMTDHDTNRRCSTYCTDTLFGTIGAVHEALLFSGTDIIEVLPALPSAWLRGSINGLMSRSRVHVQELAWNLETGHISVLLLAQSEDRDIRLMAGVPWTMVTVDGVKAQPVCKAGERYVSLSLQADADVNIVFSV